MFVQSFPNFWIKNQAISPPSPITTIQKNNIFTILIIISANIRPIIINKIVFKFKPNMITRIYFTKIVNCYIK